MRKLIRVFTGALAAADPHQSPLTFSIVTPPDQSHGSLGTITPTSNNSAEVWFTPFPGYCGQANFEFKVSSMGSWPSDNYYRIRYSYYDSAQWRQTHYSNIASPTGNCDGDVLESPPATVTIQVGRTPQAYSNWPQTCKDVPVEITLSGFDPCNPTPDFEIVTPPANGQLTGTVPNLTYVPNTAFCGTDSFTFKIKGDCFDSQPATVTINVGDPSPVAQCQDVMTEKGEPVTITLCGSDSCGDNLSFTVVSGPNNGVLLGGITQISGTCATVTYEPDSGFEGTDTFSFTAENCGFVSSWQSATIRVVPGPELTATCGPDSILLRWVVPPWVGNLATDFQIKRKTAGGSYSVIHTAGALDRDYEDTTVSSGVTYCYIVTMRRQSPCDSAFSEVESNEVCLSTCSPPPCNEPKISDWVFTDEGFIEGNQNGAFRSYTDPSQVAASPWSFPTTPDCLTSSSGLLLRMDFENDNTCEAQHGGSPNPNTQIATAEAVISVGCLTRLTVDWCGMAEQQAQPFELMTLHVNEVPMADAHAPGGGLGCALMAPAVPRAGSPLPPHYIDLQPGMYLLRIRTDTVDWRFHYDAYYEFLINLLPLE